MPIRFNNVPGGSFVFNNGNDMPKVGFGTGQIVDQEKMTNAIRAALSAGYRLFDTAHLYENEEVLGVAFKALLPELGITREEVFITTKVPIVNGKAALTVQECVKESLQKLQTDYLDLVLIHYPRDRDTGNDDDAEINEKNREEAWKTLEEIHLSGKTIRNIGVSNYEIFHLHELFKYAKVRPVLNQCQYTPYLTKPQLKKFCEDNHIIFQAYSSLCNGNQDILKEPIVQKLVQKYDVSPQDILYAFGLFTNASVIPKSETPSRIRTNLHNTIKAALTPEETKELLALNKNRGFCPGCVPTECL